MASDRRPRVLLITPDFPPSPGGIQVVTHRIATLASRLNVRVVTPTYQKVGMESGAPDGSSALARGRDDAMGVDVVRSGGTQRTPRLLRLSARAVAEGAGWADLIISGHIVCAPAAAILRRLTGTPVVQYFFAQEIPNRPRLASFAARHSMRNVSISSYTTALLRSHVARAAPTVQIPPGVDLAGDRHASRPREPTIVVVGRLRDRYKGHDVLIEAMASVTRRRADARLVVIGDGPLRGELENHVRRLGLETAVRFAGQVTDAERDRILDDASIFCMPSRLRDDGAGEGFGIVYLEASARGLPVVAGAVGGASDAIVHGKTGLLVDPCDPDAVAAALQGLLDDSAVAHRMGTAGVERAKTFAWPLIVGQIEDLVFEVLKQER